MPTFEEKIAIKMIISTDFLFSFKLIYSIALYSPKSFVDIFVSKIFNNWFKLEYFL